MKLTHNQHCVLNLHIDDVETGNSEHNSYFVQLVIKTAQLIAGKGSNMQIMVFVGAIATNNIDDIEALCYELIGEKNES